MQSLKQLFETLPAEAADLPANATRLLGSAGPLDPTQTWGSALAAAHFIRCQPLSEAVRTDARAAGLSEAHEADARAAAAIMGMNTVYFRFRHIMHSEAYTTKPFNLRMHRMKEVATDQAHFELYSIGPAALAGCELCLKAHEAAVKKGGLSEDHVHEVVRIAAVLHGLAVALEMDPTAAEKAR